MTKNYDSGYHLLFSHPKLMKDLIYNFVPESWVEQLDFSTLQRVNAKFHSEGLERREGDIIYRALLKNGEPIYLYLLLEFQSRSDTWMAVRVGTYVHLLYQQLINEKQISAKTGLPPVFPIVLYNGDKPWKAALDVKELIALPKTSPLWAYQPNMRYYVIEERLHPHEKGDSLTGLLFELENCQTPAELKKVINRLTALMSQPDDTELARAFTKLIILVLSQKKDVNLQIEDVTELSEIQAMLSTRVEQWEEKILEKGREEGLEKGIEKGRVEGREEGRVEGRVEGKQLGESNLLYRQLERRFSPLPSWVDEKLSTADGPTLERWGLNLLDAETLEDVFK